MTGYALALLRLVHVTAPPVQIMNCNNKKGFKSKCDNLTTAYKAVPRKSQESFGDQWLL